MERFRNILVACAEGDGVEAAVDLAASLAIEGGGQVTLADVIGDGPSALERLCGAPLEACEGSRARLRRLEALADRARGLGAVCHVALRRGPRHTEIIREAVARRADLVIKAAVGEKRAEGGAAFGDLALQLLRACPVPVWLLRGDRVERLTQVLAAVAPPAQDAPDAPERDRLDEAVVALADDLAERDGAGLEVVTARPACGAAEDALIRARLQAFLDGRGRPAADRVVRRLDGAPSEAIPAEVAAVGAGVVVMGTVRRAELGGRACGSDADALLKRLDCSVIAVKPAGFLSPVSAPDL